MFGIGIGELVVIAIVLLIAVGPERLPTMMKTAGRTMRQVRKATLDFREQIGLDDMLSEDVRISVQPNPLAVPRGSKPAAPITSTPSAATKEPAKPATPAPQKELAVHKAGPLSKAEMAQDIHTIWGVALPSEEDRTMEVELPEHRLMEPSKKNPKT